MRRAVLRGTGGGAAGSGAEYVYLRESFGYTVAFMSAVVSLVAGFSAPIAAVLKSLVRYLTHFIPQLDQELAIAGIVSLNDLIAVGLAWVLVLIHLRGLKGGIGFNDVVTALKILGIVLLLAAAAFYGEGDLGHLSVVGPSFEDMTLPDRMGAFATSLVFVMFCYAGYNAACYMASEVKDPQRVLPRAILGGTVVVILLYLGLNLFYFYGADVSELAGKVEVGLVAAKHLFGTVGTGAVTVLLIITLLSAASAMTVAGPRVTYAMGKDFPVFSALCRVSPGRGVPSVALVLQGAVVIMTGGISSHAGVSWRTMSLLGSSLPPSVS